jgi:biopolymer transport protein ExbB/TolQ
VVIGVANAVKHAFEVAAPLLAPIVVISAVGGIIIVERYIVFKRASRLNKDDFLQQINSKIMTGDIRGAIHICSQARGPLPDIVRAGLVAVSNHRDPEEVQTAMDAVALRDIPKLEKRIEMVAMLANVAVLLGLFGTVVGMIGAFGAAASLPPSEKAAVLAKEISVAMNATAGGLIVSIALFIAYGWLQGWMREIIDNVHEASVATLNFMLTNREKVSGPNGGQFVKRT